MDVKNRKFSALTPEVLEENKYIYTEALDYAFANTDIKNIAITGIYGAGKSTIWKTYIREKKFKNIITVTLGKYEENLSVNNKEKINEVTASEKLIDDSILETKNSRGNSESNRIERQIINQILSQVDSNKIPLSRYGFKKNKTLWNILNNSFSLLSFFLFVVIWIVNGDIEVLLSSMSMNSLFYIILFLYPFLYWSSTFFKYNRIRLSKINIKGTEAKFDDLKNNDETILERDMKEIVYLLDSSGADVIVFEDLDRYDNIELFTKLRELNFLLNSFTATQEKKHKKNIRFVYLLKDGLFLSKQRTKFFDFIIPVVPIIDSKNSQNKLSESLNGAENVPDEKVINQISLYIDDMRLLKNIVNEYLVYENIIAIKELKLDPNKLFALIALKNIFPREFDLLQGDKGYIYKIFEKINVYRDEACRSLGEEIDAINEELRLLENRHENSKFEAMAAMISPNVYLVDGDNYTSWTDFLKEKSVNSTEGFNVVNNGCSSEEYYYDTFIEKYVVTNDERRELIDKLPEDNKFRIDELLKQKKKKEKQIREINLYSVRDVIKFIKKNDVDEIFKAIEDDITHEHYFPLVRFLILQGLIDETYWYYKGCFYHGSLGKNDTIFLKNLLEAKKQDVFLDIENVNEVKNRLDIDDFYRFNILNKKLLEHCIASNCIEELSATIESTIENELYDLLMSILDEFKCDLIKKLVSIIIDNNEEQIIKILENAFNKESIAYTNILISVSSHTYTDVNVLRKFNIYIEQNEYILPLMSDEEFEAFTNNVQLAKIKFYDIYKTNTTESRMINIEKLNAYKLNVKNVIYIAEALLGRTIEYGNLLGEIYKSESLESTRQYIESNFVDFVEYYIDENVDNKPYRNKEYIVIDILNSDLPIEYKLKYVKYNEEIVSDISKIDNLRENIILVDTLIERNKMMFNSNNINIYWESIDEFDEKFCHYFDCNINDDNYEEILSENIGISNSFINYPMVSKKVFDYTIIFADEKINDFDINLEGERITKLIELDLLSITNENLKSMLENMFYNEIVMLVEKQSIEEQSKAIDMILNFEITLDLAYELVNSDISDDNAIKILDSIIEEILIERIDFRKLSIIKYLMEQDLSDININFICKNFARFKLKEEFLEYLDVNKKYSKIEKENFNKAFIELVFSKEDISVDSKIDIIITMIENNDSKDELIKFISKIEEIADLTTVWERRWPALNNPYKQRIGEKLIEKGYVSERNNNDYMRIMERKKR